MRSDGRNVVGSGKPLVPLQGKARSARQSRIVVADHDRLVVTYSARDDVVYLLRPPGEDPRTVLRAARLVLHDEIYRELAGYLGVPPSWQAGWETGALENTGELAALGGLGLLSGRGLAG
jgi:hypothetical protein